MRTFLIALLITLSTPAYADIVACKVRQAVYIDQYAVVTNPEHEYLKKEFSSKFIIVRSDTDITLILDGDSELEKYDFRKLSENLYESYWIEKFLDKKANFRSLTVPWNFFKEGGVANLQHSGNNFRMTLILGCKTS